MPMPLSQLTREKIQQERLRHESEQQCWIGFSPFERKAWSQVLDVFRPKEHSVLTQLMIRNQLSTTGIVVLASWSQHARLFDAAGFTPQEYYELNVSIRSLPKDDLAHLGANRLVSLNELDASNLEHLDRFTISHLGWDAWLESVRSGVTPLAALRSFMTTLKSPRDVRGSAENKTESTRQGEQ